MIYMRNKQTGEIKAVVPQSQEFNQLKKTVDPNGRPLWEQTGAHHATLIVDRAEAGDLREQDLGELHKPLDPVLNAQEYQAELAPYRNLTAAEVKAGLTPESKAREVQEMFSEGNRPAQFASAETAISGSDNPKHGHAPASDNELDGMTRAQLKEHADTLGVEVPGNATKAELRAAIDEHGSVGASEASA